MSCLGSNCSLRNKCKRFYEDGVTCDYSISGSGMISTTRRYYESYDCGSLGKFKLYIPIEENNKRVIEVDKIRNYILSCIDEWNNLGDRKYDLPNMQVYNHLRKELDDLEEYVKNN